MNCLLDIIYINEDNTISSLSPRTPIKNKLNDNILEVINKILRFLDSNMSSNIIKAPPFFSNIIPEKIKKRLSRNS